MYNFHDFHSPSLSDVDFEVLPQVLVIGQYSTGKSSLIKHLLRSDFPGIRVGPEPTTDRFIVVGHGDGHHVVPGHALVMDAQKPFTPLSKFGSSFLNRWMMPGHSIWTNLFLNSHLPFAICISLSPKLKLILVS